MISPANTRPLPEACGKSRCEMIDLKLSDRRMRTPACASTVWDSGSTGPMRSIRDRSRTTASLSAVAPPQTPEPAPLGTTAVPVWLAQARTVATSPVVAGEMTAAGSGRSSPRTRRSNASDQESIARWRRVCRSVLTVPPGRRLARISRELTRRIVDPGWPGRPGARRLMRPDASPSGRAPYSLHVAFYRQIR